MAMTAIDLKLERLQRTIFDWTQAVEPLESDSEWKAGELPETYPSTL